MSASKFKRIINWYPPFIGAGVRVDRVSADYLEIDVSMPLRWYNRNYVGVHFGGSLYSMVDPFLMLMLMQHLSDTHIVWDKAARIEFVAPGRGRVFAHFRLSLEEIARIRAEAESGAPTFPEFRITVVDEAGATVALVDKTLYVRKKKPKV